MRALRSIAVAGVAIAALAAGIGSAYADPQPPGTQPALTDQVAVGSDTIQFVADKYSTDYNATSPTNKFYSWDAVNPTTGLPGDTISTKGPAPTNPPTNPCTMTRPNGSGSGIAQLQKKIKTSDGVHYCVDMARASRQIKSSDGTGIASVLIGKDLITWSAISGGNQVSNLSDAELTAIYQCNANLLPSGDTQHSGPVLWSDLKNDGGTSATQIRPILPQANSGTRQQWQTDINVSNAQLGSCVINGVSPVDGTTIEENEGTNSVFTSKYANFKDDLFPYSGGDFVCQVYTKACPAIEGSLLLQNIDGKAPLTSTHTINVSGLSAFPSLYIRGLYFVVLNAGTASAPKVPTSPTDLTKFLGQGNNTGWVCGTTGQADTKNFGFAVPSNCGALVGQ